MISASRALLLSMLLPMLGVLPAIPAVCADKAAAAVKPGQPRTVLVFSLTRGFRHESIAATTRALKEIGAESGAFTVTESEDPAVFEPESLRKYDAVVMNNPTGDLFLPPDLGKLDAAAKAAAIARSDRLRASFADFVKGGKGLVGMHAATDCFYEWPEYGEMIGGYFSGHPWTKLVGVKVDPAAPPELVAAFGGRDFEVDDEIYQFRAPYSREKCRVLLVLDRIKTPEKGDRGDDDYAMAWVKQYGAGRVFYCGLGHNDAVLRDPAIRKFLLDGMRFALGDLKADTTPSAWVAPAPAEMFMGEYAGEFRPAKGKPVPATARVVPQGWGQYRIAIEAGTRSVEAEGRMEGRSLNVSKRTMADTVVEWSIAGPYRKEGLDGEKLFGEAFAPEDPAAKAIKWVKAKAGTRPEQPWAVDLLKAFGGGENAVAYLKARITSPIAQEAMLAVGSDDGIKAWLNGELVHANDVMRGVEQGQDKVKVMLRKGSNVLLLKVNQGGGDWAASADLTPLGGKAVGGVKGRKRGETAWTGTAGNGEMSVSAPGEGTFTLKRTARHSPTEGAKPPEGAVVLLPFGQGPPSLGEWTNQNWLALPDGSVQVRGGDNLTKRSFGDIELHLEFMVPLIPEERGQGRGNSGVYLQDRYEVQVLDSFGLPTADNECGGIYKVAVPKVNACLPPLDWQTYDVKFTAPRLNADGSVAANPRISVRQNGVVIHDNVEIPHPTGGGAEGFVKAGPIKLQDHGHAVKYRNTWLREVAP